MEYKEIRDLSALMREMGLTALEYSEGGARLRLERAAGFVMPLDDGAKPESDIPVKIAASADRPGIYTVTSPMVGVLYLSPSANAEPYVRAGDTVRAGDVLCIIEAMKIMNEITAEQGGRVVEVCLGNKQIVEYGQALFRLDTAAIPEPKNE